MREKAVRFWVRGVSVHGGGNVRNHENGGGRKSVRLSKHHKHPLIEVEV